MNTQSGYLLLYKNRKPLLGCAKRDYKQSYKHKEKDKKLKWSLEYTNMVRRCLGEDLLGLNLLDEECIGYVRDSLNEAYEEGNINFSVPVCVYVDIVNKLRRLPCRDNNFCVDLSPYYYNCWSENKV